MDFKTSPLMYILAAGVIVFVIVQSVFFIVKAWKRGRELGVESEKMKQTVISSVLFTIAPAISILATVLALASALGIVLPWIRLSVIGNLAYETVAAESALSALGSSLANEVTDKQQFSTIAWTMTIGSCFPLVLLPIFCKRIHKAMNKVTSKSATANALGGILGTAAFLGIVAAFISRSIAGVPSDGPALDWLSRKKGVKKLEPFVLPIAMFGAMGIAVLLTQILPPEIAGLTWR